MVTQNSTLSQAEAIQILSILAHRGPCGAPAVFRGELPITLEQIAAWRQALAAYPPSPLTEAILSAMIFAEAILAPLAHRRRLLETVRRWRMGEAFESTREFLARNPNRPVTPDWLAELEIHLQACRTRRKSARGRLFRGIESLFQPLRVWRQLPAAAEAFLRSGRPADAAVLEELLESLANSLTRGQQRIVQKLEKDLSGCGRPRPTLGEMLRSLKLLGELLKGTRSGPALPQAVREAQAEIERADRLFGADEESAWRGRFEEIVKRIVRLAQTRIAGRAAAKPAAGGTPGPRAIPTAPPSDARHPEQLVASFGRRSSPGFPRPSGAAASSNLPPFPAAGFAQGARATAAQLRLDHPLNP